MMTVVGRRAAMIATGLSLAAALSACSQDSPSEGGATTAPRATGTSASPSASAPAVSAEERLAAFCASNTAAAKAVQGTVADDIVARQAQAQATRALLPIPGASAEVAAGAQSFIAAADETVDILRQFPPETTVADIGTDPDRKSVV